VYHEGNSLTRARGVNPGASAHRFLLFEIHPPSAKKADTFIDKAKKTNEKKTKTL
jgi:hypothetical protein